MGPPRNAHSRPRRHGGGRSALYEERRQERGSTSQYAAEWSDAAAQATFDALHAGSESRGVGFCRHTEDLLGSGSDGIDQFVSRECLGISAADRALAAEIIGVHEGRLSIATTRDARARRVRSFLKPLRDRAKARGHVERMNVPAPVAALTGTFQKWLSGRPEAERQRLLPEGGRTQVGVSSWPLEWKATWGVVCYERAAGRLLAEGVAAGAAPDEAAVRGFVHTDWLPTAVANPADHYLLLGPHGEVRYMTVEEVARSFGIPSRSPLTAALVAPDVMTAVQAVECLGRGVHVGVARWIVRGLVARGLIGPGATYGSAYSGVDCVAAALDEELGGRWEYCFASERLPHARRGLLRAWGARGLEAERCHEDATRGAAVHESTVDLWVMTPGCEAFSRRNRGRSREAQRAAMGEIWRSLSYVRAATPRVVVVENLAEPEVSEPLTGLLQRLAGYEVETGTLDPRRALGEPMARERRFWVLRRKGEAPPHAANGEAPPGSAEGAQEAIGAAHLLTLGTTSASGAPPQTGSPASSRRVAAKARREGRSAMLAFDGT